MSTATRDAGETEDAQTTPSPLRRWRWRGIMPGTDPVVRAAVLVLPLVRLLMVLPVTPSVYPDGRTYRTKGSWLDFSWTSFDGYSVRPWGVTVWMALWPGDRAIMVSQALLSGIAWGILALTLSTGIRNVLVRRLLVLALVLLACSAPLANWDSVIQGDSLPMSTGILALAALVWLVRDPGWGRAAVFSAAALWYSMTRPNLFVVLVLWAVGLGVIALVRRRMLVLGVTAAVLLLFAGYSYAYNVRSDAAWTDKMGWARTTVGMAYPLGRYDPVAKEVIRDFRETDAPTCLFPNNPQEVTHDGTTAWIAKKVATCPGVDEWGSQHWQRWWLSWLVHHPSATLSIIRSQLPESLSPSVWGTVVAATPDSVSTLFLGSQKLPQSAFPNRSYRTQPLLFWFTGALALAVFARARRWWRDSPWAIDVALLATVVGCLGAAVSSGLLIQTVPHEVAQESLGATAPLTAAAVTLVAVGLDRVLRRPAGRD